jgi:hypothetical protein
VRPLKYDDECSVPSQGISSLNCVCVCAKVRCTVIAFKTFVEKYKKSLVTIFMV